MKSLLLFLMLSFSLSRTTKDYSLLNGIEERYDNLSPTYSYYFRLDTTFDDTFKFRLKLRDYYYPSDLDLYYYCHTWSYEEYYATRWPISPKSSTKDSYLILEKEIDIDDDYTTLIVEPTQTINILYVKLSSENEAITGIILMAIFIPLGFCIVVAVIIFACVRCCRYKRVIIGPGIGIAPIQPTVTVQPAVNVQPTVAVQPMYVQPTSYQPPTTQMQYIPPPTEPNAQYVPPPY